MPRLKSKDIISLSKEDKEKKLKELKLELVKAKISASKAGTSKVKEIKRTIARILTFNKSKEKKSKEELKKAFEDSKAKK
jgi:ribosomal protein L29